MATAKSEEIIRLNDKEKFELQNIMLRMALEQERLQNLNYQVASAKQELAKQEGYLNKWKDNFDKRLKKMGLSLDKVDIDAESGIVSKLNVKSLKAMGG